MLSGQTRKHVVYLEYSSETPHTAGQILAMISVIWLTAYVKAVKVMPPVQASYRWRVQNEAKLHPDGFLLGLPWLPQFPAGLTPSVESAVNLAGPDLTGAKQALSFAASRSATARTRWKNNG